MSVSRAEADRVLRLKSREREGKACYPCRKRKVKCDGNHPCRTCQKRKHPDICTYAFASSRRSQANTGSHAAPASSPPIGRDDTSDIGHNTHAQPDAQPDAQLDAQPDTAKNYVYSGDNSVLSILRSRASDANDSMAREVGSVLGLQNTFSSYPFMDSKTPREKWESLLGVLPQRSEILKYVVHLILILIPHLLISYLVCLTHPMNWLSTWGDMIWLLIMTRFFHYYRVTAYPFNPILADMDRFEADMCTYLGAHASGELRDPTKITDRWATDKSIGHISLLLATLAAGAHYSDVEQPERLDVTTDFARRSFHALRLANFLFRPSLDIVQALLILGNTLQNMGQSDAAWALLGTTVRLAQTMGLHNEGSSVHWPEYVQGKVRKLWRAIVWQDSLLCMCYDRPPIVSVTGWPLDAAIHERLDLSYAETMHLICRLGLDIMRLDGSTGIDQALEGLQKLDGIGQKSQHYLRSREYCMSLQQNLEHLALRMHTSFCVSVLCRPAMKQSQAPQLYPHGDLLRARAKGSLIDASKAFLDFQALSIVSLRSWSMVHTVLSSTLLLCIWEETRHDPECRSLQQRVIDVFSTSDSKATEEGPLLSDNETQWLSARHIRALVTLRTALDREGDRVANEPQNLGVSYDPFPPLQAGSNLDSYMDVINPFDTSPVSYLDSIMNVPLFDFTQENGFL
ncbi:hypothetical protein N7456_001441 [Penicillium angulare]|uniref:Zn(2)-C6 fungal-type domain-containing protein n=1 Tax=Penicillium angulare TaxID=116970 RepID=A0A9W9KPA7_9EURO|nr:hypothetical protein N7456_001441 [Penicillium angulare]